MADRYDDADRSITVPPELDEYICEYIDGTMDPSVREAFEEFLEANPAVAGHVERLIETASILKACADHCPCVADDFQNRLRCAVEHECVPDAEPGAWLDRLTGAVLVTSAVTLFCLAVLVPPVTTELHPMAASSIAESRFKRADPLAKVRYHQDRPAMVRLGPSTPVPPSYVGLGLQPTYRDVSAEARYFASSTSP